MAKCVIFYSWQSDHPNNINRNFIQQALERVAKDIRQDDSIQVEPVVDRDTQGVPGSPDIVETIFSKINQSQIFVCDVSVINQGCDRLSPNPNVLIELGYAIRSLGWERIIMVMNSAFGQPDKLPFDLKTKRVTLYNAKAEETDLSQKRRLLQGSLKNAVLAILPNIDLPEKQQESSLGQQATSAVEAAQSNRIVLVRRYMDWLLKTIKELAPVYSETDVKDETLIRAISSTNDLIAEFSLLSEAISAVPDSDSASIVFEKLGGILEYYEPRPGISGIYQATDFDFFKFLGHESFTTFFSFLLSVDRWDLITELIEQDIYLPNSRRSKPLSIDKVSEFIELLDNHNRRLKLRRVSFHADLLRERHTEGPISQIAPFDQFLDADFFLFLRKDTNWRPWSAIWLGSRVPRFLIKASSAKYAEKMFRPLKIQSLDELRELIREKVEFLHRFYGAFQGFFPLEDFNHNSLGSK